MRAARSAALFTLLALSSLVGSSCRRAPPRTSREDAGPALEPPCERGAVTWLVPRGDAGELDLPRIEGGALVTVRPGAYAVAWADAVGRRVVLAREGRTSALDLGVGEYTPPVLALVGGLPALAWVRQGPGGRVHVVASGERLEARCEQTEGLDDGMSVALAGLGASEALVAWDEDRPGGGVVRAQRVALRGEAGCGPARELSPSGEDASDPVLLGLPGGGAAAFWLAARDLEATVANETATEVHGVRVGPDGARRGETLRVTATPAHRFGLSAALAGGAVWLAFRVADESDTEGRGDGGSVAVVRVEQDLSRAGEVAVVTGREANPTGAPRVIARGSDAEVWWLERRSEGTVTARRRVGRAGLGAPREEPVFEGSLPASAQGDAVVALLRGPTGEPGVGRFRCPSSVSARE